MSKYDKILERWMRAHPIECHQLGIHTYDGKFPKYDSISVDARIDEIRKDLEDLKQIDIKSKMDEFENNLIKYTLETELFELEERREFESSPLPWIFPLTLIEMSYTVRNYGTIGEITETIIEFERNIPDFMQTAMNVIKNPSLEKIKIGIDFLTGIIAYFTDKLIGYISGNEDDKIIEQWVDVNTEAVNAMKKFLDFLKKLMNRDEIKNRGSILGKDRFMKLLEKTEGIKIDIDLLLERGENDLRRNIQELHKLANIMGKKSIRGLIDDIKLDYPSEEKLMGEVNIILKRTREFARKVVDIPSDDLPIVIPTPQFARGFGFAAMNTPGPFEDPLASQSYFWITPPNPNWSDIQIKEYMKFFNRPFLEIVTVHEAFPGHFVQLLYNRKSTSYVSKLLARSITMIEGWAHYCEEMIYDEGYNPFDRNKLKVGQLLGAIQRDIRYIVAIRMHCMGMSVDEAKMMFMEKGFLSEKNAEIEAYRGLIDPMYLNYTLGKLLILKLREDYKNEQGDKFNLYEFHNKLLSYGSAPITLLRKIMLKNNYETIL